MDEIYILSILNTSSKYDGFGRQLCYCYCQNQVDLYSVIYVSWDKYF